jgi:uncharacterized protein YdaU (DUF1376 family)
MSHEWYKWYPALYRADTMHLTAEQDGIYRRLIDHYIETRQPLPDNDHALARISGVSLDSWIMAAAIVRPFFQPCPEQRLRHKRCDMILAEQEAASNKQKEKGKAGAEKRWSARTEKKQENSSGHTPAIAEEVPNDSRIDKNRIDKNSINRPAVYSSEFEEFWIAYPRHDCSKAEALKSYQSIIREGIEHGRIITGTKEFRANVERNGTGQRFIPHASTWLNQRRWEADYRDERPYLDGKPNNQLSEKQRATTTFAAIIERRNAEVNQGLQGQPEPANHPLSPMLPAPKGLW